MIGAGGVRAFVLLLSLAYSAGATEIRSGDFSFHLPGEWVVSTGVAGSIRAHRDVGGVVRAFELSVYDSSSVREGATQLIGIREFLSNLHARNPNLVKLSDFSEFESSRLPFHYVVYSYKQRDAFFLAATLGSSLGNVMLTYEGNGTTETGVEELETIVDAMTYTAR